VRQIRLLPIVIVAGAALLLIKGFGIMTSGGYVLTGPTRVQAAGTPTSAGNGSSIMALPIEPTMVDESPTIDDHALTMPMADGANEHAEGEAEAASTEGESAEQGAAGGEAAGTEEAAPVPDISENPVHSEPAAAGEAAADAAGAICPEGEESVLFASPDGSCLPKGDAVPMTLDEAGNPVPLTAEDAGVGSEDDVLRRLAERREVLDAREAELQMRLALVEAAEARIAERTAALEVLEARINAMVDEKRVLEEAQFTALVAMYETMKPKDAAAIFDQLEADVLLRVARAINPRKMAPIMAKMDPMKAKDLTAGLAVDQVEPTIDLSGEDLASLPQIVGQ
jgi:flagellar motility protein MotE (MotC chaperone)